VAVNEQFGLVGTPVWDLKWDVLVIREACRVDLIQEQRGNSRL
jgi:hypothetical protein